jgi:putative peptidoglycan lipid II flippase
MVVFLALGDVVAAAIFQTGRFGREDVRYVWGILAGSAAGLLASTLGRLYASTFYALRDTKTPLRYAVARVALATLLGYSFAIPLPRLLGLPPSWGAAGIALAGGLAAWAELLLLRRSLTRRIGPTGTPFAFLVRLWVAAMGGAAAAWAIKLAGPVLHPVMAGLIVMPVFAVAFFGLTVALGVPEASTAVSRLAARIRSGGSRD